MDIRELYHHFRIHPYITTDSRKVIPGSLFFALKGERFDGNRFAAQALERGASLAVVSDPAMALNERYLLVDDTLKTLQDLARYHRKQMDLPVIALTGTNGKTTTKELIVAVLSKKYRVTGTQGNLNNHIGVPLTILSANDETEILVVEMGANHPGEIAFLCSIADPTHGLVTNVGHAHLEGFGSFEKVVATKTELYNHLMLRKGKVYYHASDPHLAPRARLIRNRLSYGVAGSDADVLFEPPEEGVTLTFTWHSPEGDRKVVSRMYGRYNFTNMMAAITVGTDLDVPPEEVVSAVETYVPENMRSQVVHTPRGNIVILDAYNANPASMKAALETFHDLPGKEKAVVLGDMLELGVFAKEEHKKIVKLLREKGPFREVLLIGPRFREVCDEASYHTFGDPVEAGQYLEKKRWQGMHVLLKGSRGMGLESLMDKL